MMSLFLFCAIYLPVVFVSIWLLRYLYGTRFLLTPMHIYASLYLIVVCPGGVLLFIEHGTVDYAYLIIVLSGILLPLFSAACLGGVSSVRGVPCPQWAMKRERRIPLVFLALVLALDIITLTYMQSAFSNAPLLLIIFGEDEVSGATVAVARESVIQGGGKLFALMSLLPRVVLLLMAMYLLYKMKISLTKHNRIVRFVFIVTVLSGTWTCMLSGSKAIAIYFLMQLGMFYLLIRGQGVKANELKWLVVSFVGANLYLWLWYYFMFGDLRAVFHAWSHRFFITYPQLIYETVNVFPARYDFLLGRTFPNPKGILPFENVNFAMFLGEIHKSLGDHATAERLNLHTVANTAAVAEWYANFGFLGSILWGLIAGMLLHGLYLWYRASRREWPENALYAIFSLKWGLLAVQYTGSLLDYASILLVVWYVLVRGGIIKSIHSAHLRRVRIR